MSSLINKKNFKFDLSGKSPAFFLRNKNLKINNKLMKDLINFSKKNNDINCRICLHKNKKDKIHSMIVLINRKNSSKKHKHSKSDEIYNLIQGSFNILIFKDNRVKKILMSNRNNIIYTVKKGIIHNIEPINKIIIFHEIKLNPYKN